MMTDYDNSSPANVAWVKLYAGTLEVRISLPVVSVDGEVTAAAANRLLVSIANLKAAGFAETLPDQKAGQHVEEVNTLVIGETTGKGTVDGKVNTAYCVVYYSTREGLIYRAYGKHYLNNDEDVALFEATTGIKPSQVANKWAWSQKKGAAPVRNDPDAAKYFYHMKVPVRVAFVVNPDYNPDETDVSKKKSQYDFDGYLGLPAAPNAASKPAGQPPPQPGSSEAGKQNAVSDEQNWDKAKPLLAAIFPKGGISHAQHVFKLLQDAGILDKKDGVTAAIKKMTAYRDCRENGSLPEKPTADQITTAFAALAESQMADGADVAF